jgi:8-oxo-dGTP pyrophosphatase MutT (NUDIX family)
MTDILSKLEKVLAGNLPGNRAHQQMISYARPSAEVIRSINVTPKESAVLILLYKKNNRLHFPLILRPEYDGVHSRQVGLPGGQKESEDLNLNATAVRETFEEIGAVEKNIKIIGSLTEIYIPPSNFLVKPVVGIYEPYKTFIPDESEVSQILTSSLHELIDLKIEKKDIYIRKDKTKTTVSCFTIEDKIVWGATAMILYEFRALLLENSLEKLYLG